MVGVQITTYGTGNPVVVGTGGSDKLADGTSSVTLDALNAGVVLLDDAADGVWLSEYRSVSGDHRHRGQRATSSPARERVGRVKHPVAVSLRPPAVPMPFRA